jgi:hypothetical protein
VELHRSATNWGKVVDDIVKLERKIFPKHESLARSFDEELWKKNSGLLYMDVDGEVVGYVMYSWPSSMCASVTKLAGSKPIPIFFVTFFFCQINDFFFSFQRSLDFHLPFLSMRIVKVCVCVCVFFLFMILRSSHLSCFDDFSMCFF